MTDGIVINGLVRSEIVTVRKHAEIMRNGLRQILVHHLDATIPQHFLPSAVSKYGYQPRTKAYQIRKTKGYYVKATGQRITGHQRPLWWSGRMEKAVQQTSRITATQYQSRLVARNYFPLSAIRRAEIEIVTSAEQGDMTRRLEADYMQEINKPENRAKRIHRTK